MSVARQPESLVDVFKRGMHEADDNWQVMPQRLRGRGVWLQERGRIKDCELMFDAATEIEDLRNQLARIGSRACSNGCNGCEECTDYEDSAA